MSIKAQSLGGASSAVDLLLISAATNATPIVCTIGANSGLKTGDRIAIAGITGNTAANGEWTITVLTATTFSLAGSVGNGAFGGTPRVARIFDLTPTMKNHSAILQLGGNFVGTLTLTAFESYSEFAANDNSLGGTVVAPIQAITDQGVTNVNATSASLSTKATSAIVVAATNSGAEFEIKLNRYVTGSVTAYTSGSLAVKVQA